MALTDWTASRIWKVKLPPASAYSATGADTPFSGLSKHENISFEIHLNQPIIAPSREFDRMRQRNDVVDLKALHFWQFRSRHLAASGMALCSTPSSRRPAVFLPTSYIH
jgi:hypothetical protein